MIIGVMCKCPTSTMVSATMADHGGPWDEAKIGTYPLAI